MVSLVLMVFEQSGETEWAAGFLEGNDYSTGPIEAALPGRFEGLITSQRKVWSQR